MTGSLPGKREDTKSYSLLFGSYIYIKNKGWFDILRSVTNKLNLT